MVLDITVFGSVSREELHRDGFASATVATAIAAIATVTAVAAITAVAAAVTAVTAASSEATESAGARCTCELYEVTT
ncbi:hypothetical protein Harman_23690 [Haloarcula mannanilytica]|uniref:Uncharacterized protein n=1 Tax=Haloarcula mannanilytica TaxID=2509225 RepID=A0A4C2EIW4_9EURY|nr:hypothetical protein Harman_23690 [Haloarcula mannanilytica]